MYSQGMVVVENVTVLSISSYDELKNIIERGSEQRHTTGTMMNEESSRSHLILSVIIESTNLQSQSVSRGKVLYQSISKQQLMSSAVWCFLVSPVI